MFQHDVSGAAKTGGIPKTFRGCVWLLPLLLATWAFCAEPPAGKIVWWGLDISGGGSDTPHSNGVVEIDGEILTNAIAIVGGSGQGLALRSDGTMVVFGSVVPGGVVAPASISNAVSLRPGWESCRSMIRGGAALRFEPGEQGRVSVLLDLTNATVIRLIEENHCLGLDKDCTLFGLLSAPDESLASEEMQRVLGPVRARGQTISNVAGAARIGYYYRDNQGISWPRSFPVVLKKDGTVWALDDETSLEHADDPVSVAPVMINGRAVTNITSIAGCGNVLALKANGTVVSLDTNGMSIPLGLSNVTAIAAADDNCLALRSDGTVVAWGGNEWGQASVPVGLSNVVAIESGVSFGFALATGSVPSSVYIPPHGRLQEMEREADLIFKGEVLSSKALTNESFPDWAEPHATQFRLISALKGDPQTNKIVFWHYTGEPGAWSGGPIPETHEFETGRCYLVFAARLDKPEYLYDPPLDATNRFAEFRQLYRDGVLRTLDSRPVANHSVKDAHWQELNLLVEDGNSTNQLYGIDMLDLMSLEHGRYWGRSGDFRRRSVLSTLLPLVTNDNQQVASQAIGCFVVESSATVLEPFAGTLTKVANGGASSNLRLNAIRALSGTHFEAISNSLVQLLQNPSANTRSRAVALLALFPGDFSERALRKCAEDDSPKVRAGVADVIGNQGLKSLLPTLVRLFADPVGRDRPIAPLTLDELKSGSHIVSVDGGVTMIDDPNYPGANVGDVHTSSGFALMKFDMEHVGEILKTNISDPGFRLGFSRKLAQSGVEPDFLLLANDLKAHTADSEQEAEKNGFHWGLSYWLRGNYGWAWDTLFGHASKQTREALADPKMAAILDALQIADDPGDGRTRSLYGFFLDKGMIDHAIELRRRIIRRTEDKAIAKETFNFPALLKGFDEIDEKHSLKPGLGL
jgi:hypothetical protein